MSSAHLTDRNRSSSHARKSPVVEPTNYTPIPYAVAHVDEGSPWQRQTPQPNANDYIRRPKSANSVAVTKTHSVEVYGDAANNPCKFEYNPTFSAARVEQCECRCNTCFRCTKRILTIAAIEERLRTHPQLVEFYRGLQAQATQMEQIDSGNDSNSEWREAQDRPSGSQHSTPKRTACNVSVMRPPVVPMPPPPQQPQSKQQHRRPRSSSAHRNSTHQVSGAMPSHVVVTKKPKPLRVQPSAAALQPLAPPATEEKHHAAASSSLWSPFKRSSLFRRPPPPNPLLQDRAFQGTETPLPFPHSAAATGSPAKTCRTPSTREKKKSSSGSKHKRPTVPCVRPDSAPPSANMNHLVDFKEADDLPQLQIPLHVLINLQRQRVALTPGPPTAPISGRLNEREQFLFDSQHAADAASTRAAQHMRQPVRRPDEVPVPLHDNLSESSNTSSICSTGYASSCSATSSAVMPPAPMDPAAAAACFDSAAAASCVPNLKSSLGASFKSTVKHQLQRWMHPWKKKQHQQQQLVAASSTPASASAAPFVPLPLPLLLRQFAPEAQAQAQAQPDGAITSQLSSTIGRTTTTTMKKASASSSDPNSPVRSLRDLSASRGIGVGVSSSFSSARNNYVHTGPGRLATIPSLSPIDLRNTPSPSPPSPTPMPLPSPAVAVAASVGVGPTPPPVPPRRHRDPTASAFASLALARGLAPSAPPYLGMYCTLHRYVLYHRSLFACLFVLRRFRLSQP